MEEKDDIIYEYIDKNDTNNDEDIQQESIQETNNSDAFITGLPEWDLTPPYETVRRTNDL